MTKRFKRWISWVGASIVAMALLLSGAYLVFGWGLNVSPRTASYTFLGAWTAAGERPFSDPFAIAVDYRNGNVLVTDARNQRVVILDRDGSFIREFGTEGDGEGEFSRPTGIAVAPDGLIYVADYDQDRIQRFTERGEFVLAWGTSGNGKDQFQAPNGLAVDSGSTVYVADFQNKVIKAFKPDGTFLRTIATPGQWGAGKLDYPTDVAIGPNDTLIVADAYNYRLQEFSSRGAHHASWGWHLFWLWPRAADGHDGFNVPTGVAWDASHGVIHVADSANHRVVMLDRDGAYISGWSIPNPGAQYSPTMIAASPDGTRVYATDTAANRIIVLEVQHRSITTTRRRTVTHVS